MFKVIKKQDIEEAKREWLEVFNFLFWIGVLDSKQIEIITSSRHDKYVNRVYRYSTKFSLELMLQARGKPMTAEYCGNLS